MPDPFVPVTSHWHALKVEGQERAEAVAHWAWHHVERRPWLAALVAALVLGLLLLLLVPYPSTVTTTPTSPASATAPND